ncbi:MAG: hypothetical protein QXV48_00865 [Desulfurococcaceae archaeon]
MEYISKTTRMLNETRMEYRVRESKLPTKEPIDNDSKISRNKPIASFHVSCLSTNRAETRITEISITIPSKVANDSVE